MAPLARMCVNQSTILEQYRAVKCRSETLTSVSQTLIYVINGLLSCLHMSVFIDKSASIEGILLSRSVCECQLLSYLNSCCSAAKFLKNDDI